MKKEWLGLGCLLLLVETGFTELPTSNAAPINESYSSLEIKTHQPRLAGKVVEVQFNRILCLRRNKSGTYEGYIRCYDQDNDGARVRFSEEGLGYFSELSFKEADQGDTYAKAGRADIGVYVLVPKQNPKQLIALGDKCSENEDGIATYSWSEKTRLPDVEDLKDMDDWTVSELALYGHHVIGHEVEITCCCTREIKSISSEKYQTFINSGFGQPDLRIEFSGNDALELFEEIHEEGIYSDKEFTFYARIQEGDSGDIKLLGLGTRARGKGMERTYRW
ncbi:hypothetical protein [Tichowtungia aerotolerans]|uniref:Uncharacterized protein n=1 Tax=Tichowtungia aerotolerans TaxID=2697043 RepID=A0A6P1M7S4_9BACT|nr:hypothetical protein [Tichowtungia aerotolerans]QHI70640.1 hypothetical protein GT409_14720 [Tichowtungia aerotolerans]